MKLLKLKQGLPDEVQLQYLLELIDHILHTVQFPMK